MEELKDQFCRCCFSTYRLRVISKTYHTIYLRGMFPNCHELVLTLKKIIIIRKKKKIRPCHHPSEAQVRTQSLTATNTIEFKTAHRYSTYHRILAWEIQFHFHFMSNRKNAFSFLIDVILMCCRCLSESPRWLITQKQNDKAMEVIKRIAKGNKKQLPLSFQVTALCLLKANMYAKLRTNNVLSLRLLRA